MSDVVTSDTQQLQQLQVAEQEQDAWHRRRSSRVGVSIDGDATVHSLHVFCGVGRPSFLVGLPPGLVFAWLGVASGRLLVNTAKNSPDDGDRSPDGESKSLDVGNSYSNKCLEAWHGLVDKPCWVEQRQVDCNPCPHRRYAK